MKQTRAAGVFLLGLSVLLVLLDHLDYGSGPTTALYLAAISLLAGCTLLVTAALK